MNRDHDHPSLDSYRCSNCLKMRFTLFGVEVCPACDSLGCWPRMQAAMDNETLTAHLFPPSAIFDWEVDG